MTLTTSSDGGFANRLMERLAVPAFVIDTSCRVVIWNRACEELTQVLAGEMVGTSAHWSSFYRMQRPTLADLVVQKRTDEIGVLYPRHSTLLPDPDGGALSNIRAENWCDMPRAGRRRYLAADASPIVDDTGQLVAVVQTLRDMTDERAAHAALEQLARRDALTGLANRRCFDDTLQAEWARSQRHKQPLSLLMVDVDNFKQYNDANGHLGGDDCLRRIALAVSGEMRTNDLVARYGGEEFAVILPNESLKGAAAVAERIRRRVEGMRLPNPLAPQRLVTVSIGAATALDPVGMDAHELVAIADAALYRAKHLGRNRISLPQAELV